MATVGMMERLHIAHFHSIEQSVVPAALGVDRTLASVQARLEAAEATGRSEAFIASIRDSLAGAYQQFEQRHVVGAGFGAHCTAILRSAMTELLNSGG